MILDLDYKGLVDLSILDRYDKYKITKLNISNNKLTSLKGIEELVNLKRLYCHSNQLTTLEGISECINLEYLYCGDNKLTSLQGIEKLIYLEILRCNNNPLELIKNIEILYTFDEIKDIQELIKNELLSEVITNLNI